MTIYANNRLYSQIVNNLYELLDWRGYRPDRDQLQQVHFVEGQDNIWYLSVAHKYGDNPQHRGLMLVIYGNDVDIKTEQFEQIIANEGPVDMAIKSMTPVMLLTARSPSTQNKNRIKELPRMELVYFHDLLFHIPNNVLSSNARLLTPEEKIAVYRDLRRSKYNINLDMLQVDEVVRLWDTLTRNEQYDYFRRLDYNSQWYILQQLPEHYYDLAPHLNEPHVLRGYSNKHKNVLPGILPTDPLCRWLGGRMGDLIVIDRKMMDRNYETITLADGSKHTMKVPYVERYIRQVQIPTTELENVGLSKTKSSTSSTREKRHNVKI